MFKTRIKNNFVILLLEKDEEFNSGMYQVLDKAIEQKKKICYVILKDTYQNVKEQFKKQSLTLSNFFFIDVLSSHYTKQKSQQNCRFLSGTNMQEIIAAISEAISQHKCTVLIVDDVAHLLYHFENYEIQQFTNLLKIDQVYMNIGKVYLIPKNRQLLEEETNKLLNDLKLFADEVIELEMIIQ